MNQCGASVTLNSFMSTAAAGVQWRKYNCIILIIIYVTGFGKTLRMASARDSCNVRF